jgi:hypothetical protein
MGVVDYPVEINKMIQSDREVTRALATDFALDSGKGISRILGAGLRAPMDFSMNISKGFGNVPRLYGDDTVRNGEKVTGIDSGIGAAVKVSWISRHVGHAELLIPIGSGLWLV